MPDTIEICYRLTDPKGTTQSFTVSLDAATLALRRPPRDRPVDWARLDYHQCPNCPLEPADHRECPLAAGLVDLVRYCTDITSFDRVLLEVQVPERNITRDTTAQRAISSLMGLIIAASGCPHSAYFRPMARFHLPLAGEEETIYRATSMYLLAQYFLHQEGRATDWEMQHLSRVYQNMQIVNAHIAKRLYGATNKDSSVNALILLDLFSKTLPDTIEDSLDEIRYLFTRFLEAAPI